MKVLVAVTCIAVLGALGYFGWGEYNRSQQATRSLALVAERNRCLGWLDAYQGSNRPTEEAKVVVVSCRDMGLINQRDIEAAYR